MVYFISCIYKVDHLVFYLASPGEESSDSDAGICLADYLLVGFNSKSISGINRSFSSLRVSGLPIRSSSAFRTFRRAWYSLLISLSSE